MMLNDKRAVSAIVATVLLVLIAVAAVGIIWGAIIPMINKAMEMGQACMNARLTINTDSGYTCWNATGRVALVMVSRGAEDFKLAGMDLVVSGGGLTKTFNVSSGQIPDGVRMLEDKAQPPTMALALPNVNEERTYIVNGTAVSTSFVAQEARVAPKVRIGNTVKTCGVTHQVSLTECLL